MKIAVAGTGYVGLSNAVLLSQHNEVVAVDIIKEKVDMINDRVSPIVDKEIEYFLKNKDLNLTATTNAEILSYFIRKTNIVAILHKQKHPHKHFFLSTSIADS